jgi:cytochrome c oxidase cbb3-type subunit 3/ubiquinol-cytochrome c reductase cytochrome c subunit
VRPPSLRAVPPLWLLLAPLALGCDGLPGQPDEAERYRRPTEILDFTTLYATHCSGCHGTEGQLGPARPFDPVYLALVDEPLLREVTAQGVAGTSMPPFAVHGGGTLVDEQVDAIAAGILASWADPAKVAGAALPPYSASDAVAAGHAPGDASRGGAAFTRFCADCHGADGLGGGEAGSVVDPDMLALVSNQMLRTTVIAGRQDLGMPDWRELADRAMTPQEISDVVAWLVAQRPTSGASAQGGRDGGS